MRRLLLTACCLGVVLVLLRSAHAAEPAGEKISQSQHSLPRVFTPVDTKKLLGSPNPLPLETQRAFPKVVFTEPVELTHAGDGTNRVFVLERKGVIRVMPNDENNEHSHVFLDLRESTLSEGNEEGLLGLAFHPKFKENGLFYIYRSVKPRATLISRFKVSAGDPSVADPKSEMQLLHFPQPYENHNGGSLRFGPDGYLYVGLGDGGLANDPHGNGQNLGVLLGKILRIDVDHPTDNLKYGIPSDNPFIGRKDARAEIWAYGFRNVWRLSFDRETKFLWAGDVGQDRFEEVNLIHRGGNYGWNFREGFNAFEPQSPAKPMELIDPLVSYFRGEGASVTGGMVYRGKDLVDYRGLYFYGDYISGSIWTINYDGHKVIDNRKVAATNLNISAFGEDEQGEMYVLDLNGGVHRLKPKQADLKASAEAFPRTLSATGLYDSVKDNLPARGLIPYEVNVPFWSDYSVKDRYIALPEKGRVKYHERDKWEFPVGTVFVKTFWMHRDRVEFRDPVRLETRLFVRSSEGWAGYTYVYLQDQSDAVLVQNGEMLSLNVRTEKGRRLEPYFVPTSVDCMTCHTKAEGFVLGLNTRQMNRALKYRGESQNQIDLLADLGVFMAKVPPQGPHREAFPDWGYGNLDRSEVTGKRDAKLKASPPAPIEGDRAVLARAWLDVNCAMCHRPNSIGPSTRDFRFHTPLPQMKLVGEKPKHGNLVAPGGAVILGGSPYRSEIFARAAHRGEWQMPPLSTRLPDNRGLQVLREWIESLPPTPPPSKEAPGNAEQR